MAEYDTLLYEARDMVATITINRPDKHNAMSPAVMADLRRAFADARADADAHVVVLTGAGERAFCAGADLGASFVGEELPSPLQMHHARGDFADLLRDIWRLGMPIIAKVRGYCLAGGFGLALACDFVMAATDAKFGVPEIDRGLWPMMISTTLTTAMPPKTALELMMTGRRLSAREADEIGFLTRLVEPEVLDGTVQEFAELLASKSPAIMRLGRDAFYATLDMDKDKGLALLQSLLTVNIQAEDAAEGIQAFLEKRDPVWRGR